MRLPDRACSRVAVKGGSVKVVTYSDAEQFLQETRVALESNEAANSLMLGLCGRIIEHPERFKAEPRLWSVADTQGPVLAALITPPHNLLVYHHRGSLREGANALVDSVRRGAWQVPGVFGPSEAAQAVVHAWAGATGSPARLAGLQRAYELRQVAVPRPERGNLRPATEQDFDLAAAWTYAFHHEIFGQTDRERPRQATQVRIAAGDIFLWDRDGRPVSMAMRNRPTRHGITVSLVYTPPELRGRGYATACVGELSRLLLDSGWDFCALFADLANPTANGIYRRVGYQPVCDYVEFRFGA
jgi:predicted GNAT family acetyltransferase